MARDQLTERLRMVTKEAGVPAAVDRRIRNFRNSIVAMMGEETPRPLVDFDQTILGALDRAGTLSSEDLADRLTKTMEAWQTTPREDFYGLTPEELRDCLIKLEDLSFRDGVRIATEDPKVVASMFVLLRSGNIDYRKGAIFTLDEVSKKEPARIDFGIFGSLVTGPFSKEARVVIIENATEFGRILGRMLLENETKARARQFVAKLASSGDDTELRVALKAFTHLSKVAAQDVDLAVVKRALASDNDFNRETAARIVQNLAKHVPHELDAGIFEQMASDKIWAVRQVTTQALANWHRHRPQDAQKVLASFERHSDDNVRKVAQAARKALAKKK